MRTDATSPAGSVGREWTSGHQDWLLIQQMLWIAAQLYCTASGPKGQTLNSRDAEHVTSCLLLCTAATIETWNTNRQARCNTFLDMAAQKAFAT